MVTRKALLICANIHAELNDQSLPAELEATRQFLLSAAGGAWEEEEIIVLMGPTEKALIREIQNSEADYNITCFFGKSFPGENKRHFLVLSDAGFIEDIDLLNNSARQLVLIDDEGGSENIFIQMEPGDAVELRKARTMYDKWIEITEPGQVIMHASEGSTVNRSVQQVGLFIRKLLQVAGSIAPTTERYQLKNIIAAGQETPDLLLDMGYEEGPAITWSKGNVRLPFAMALPLPPHLLPMPVSERFRTGFDI
jgi:hypothetical protein